MYRLTLITALLTLVAASATAGDLIVYPSQGQDTAQQQKDEGECFVWAKNQSGVDPLAQNSQAGSPPPEKKGGLIKGAAAGAAVGAIVGDSDDAKKGAGAGALMGKMRQNRKNREAAAAAKEDASAQAGDMAQYNKAYGICLQGRGYTVG